MIVQYQAYSFHRWKNNFSDQPSKVILSEATLRGAVAGLSIL